MKVLFSKVTLVCPMRRAAIAGALWLRFLTDVQVPRVVLGDRQPEECARQK